MSDLYTSLRFGKLPEKLLGPTGADLTDFTRNMTALVMDGTALPLARQFEKIPAVRMVKRLNDLRNWTTENLIEYAGGGATATASNFEVLKGLRIQQKGR